LLKVFRANDSSSDHSTCALDAQRRQSKAHVPQVRDK